MFEDDTVDIACPKCGHKNSLLVREFEESAGDPFRVSELQGGCENRS